MALLWSHNSCDEKLWTSGLVTMRDMLCHLKDSNSSLMPVPVGLADSQALPVRLFSVSKVAQRCNYIRFYPSSDPLLAELFYVQHSPGPQWRPEEKSSSATIWTSSKIYVFSCTSGKAKIRSRRGWNQLTSRIGPRFSLFVGFLHRY